MRPPAGSNVKGHPLVWCGWILTLNGLAVARVVRNSGRYFVNEVVWWCPFAQPTRGFATAKEARRAIWKDMRIRVLSDATARLGGRGVCIP